MKNVIFLMFTLTGSISPAQIKDNNALFSLLQDEYTLAFETGETCQAPGRSFQILSFEEQLDNALTTHDTATVIETEELALNQLIKTTKDHPTQWLAFYWTAHLYGQVGRLYRDNDKFIDFMKKAHENFNIARNLNTNPTREDQSELLVLESLLNRLSGFTLYNPRTGVDIDRTRAEEFVRKSLDLLKAAEQENPNNPRVYLQKGIAGTYEAKYEQAISDLKRSLDLYSKFPATSKIYPNWGEGWIKVWLPRAEKLLSQSK